jgi:hypothetical protein
MPKTQPLRHISTLHECEVQPQPYSPDRYVQTSKRGAEIAKSAILTAQGLPVPSKELTTPHRRKSSRARSMEILVYGVQRKTVEAIGGTS